VRRVVLVGERVDRSGQLAKSRERRVETAPARRGQRGRLPGPELRQGWRFRAAGRLAGRIVTTVASLLAAAPDMPSQCT
jgi:hypothetical protein